MSRFGVYVSYNHKDRALVEPIVRRLHDAQLRPWFDAWQIGGGQPVPDAIGDGLEQSECCAVFLGPGGQGGIHTAEQRIAVMMQSPATRSGKPLRVIPVLLPGGPTEPAQLPVFLRPLSCIRFHSSADSDALDRLVAAVRGEPPGPGSRPVLGECPYRGLAYFDVAHAPWFFGRERITAEIVERILQPAAAPRFLAIIGASGSGKSSLARAGVLAALRGDRRAADSTAAPWPVCIALPGARPFDSLATALASTPGVRLGEGATAVIARDLATAMQQDPSMLDRVAETALGADPAARLIVLVDQFEELSTLAPTAAFPAFAALLAHAATIERGRVIVLVTLRADFYGRCAEHDALRELLEKNQRLIGPMGREDLRAAIERPAERGGAELEPGLVELLLEVGSSRVDLQACKLEYSIVSPK